MTLSVKMQKPHTAQRQIKIEAARFNVLSCGRRFGKTALGIDVAIEPALRGLPVGWFAPTYKLLLEPWRELKSALKPIASRISETERRIELVTGGNIDCWTMEDPDAGRSYKYARVIVDEAAMVDLEDRWTKAIRPTLSDYKGDAYFLSTPKGRNFFWRLWTMGQDRASSEWKSWRFPTGANPFIDPNEIEAARVGQNGVGGMPERSFQQEYLAEFLEESGGVFRGVSNVVIPGRTGPLSGTPQYRVGVDLARTEDFTVISVMDALGKQVYHERFNQISWERQYAAIANVASQYPQCQIVVDATGVGDPIYERLKTMGLNVKPFTFTNSSKEGLIDNLAMLIESQQIELLDIPEQTSELQAYQYELTPSRNVRMNAPPGMHDDCVIALALSAPEARSPIAVPEFTVY